MAAPATCEAAPIRRSARPLISLLDAKRTILGLTPETIASPDGFVTAVVNRHILAGNGHKQSFIMQVRLQALCMAGNLSSLKSFLNEFAQRYGMLATELLVNGYIPAGSGVPNCSPTCMTPILTAILWNANKEISRVLYSYGANLGVGLDNTFPEEKVHALPYFDHLSGGAWGPYPQPMWRHLPEFAQTVQEIRSLAGEPGAETGWMQPYSPVV
tara:strand:- start:6175 stop:6816 length:642 start_codon:yes stop_codon:yes gene_type:complete